MVLVRLLSGGGNLWGPPCLRFAEFVLLAGVSATAIGLFEEILFICFLQERQEMKTIIDPDVAKQYLNDDLARQDSITVGYAPATTDSRETRHVDCHIFVGHGNF